MTLKHFHKKYQGILNKCWKYLWWGVNCSDDTEKSVPENVLKTGLWIILALIFLFITTASTSFPPSVRLGSSCPHHWYPLLRSVPVWKGRAPSVYWKSQPSLWKFQLWLGILSKKKSTHISSFCCTCLCMCLKKTVTVFNFFYIKLANIN